MSLWLFARLEQARQISDRGNRSGGEIELAVGVSSRQGDAAETEGGRFAHPLRCPAHRPDFAEKTDLSEYGELGSQW